ncbi:MAG: FAD-binding oxidoreductase, partial [Myxococcota bacterium]
MTRTTRTAVASDKLVRDLEAIVGAEQVSIRDSDRLTYSRDMWPRPLLAIRDGGTPDLPRPHVVVWPRSSREVAAVVRTARQHGVPIIPYGGGSGVCGGVVPIHGGITIDVKRMNRVVSIDRDEMVCDVEAGINGERFEREMMRRGYTFGHFPSSIYCSTVGGWLATRAAGQLSAKYGKVEDRVAGLTVVTGRGEVIRTDGPVRAVRGPDWTQLLLGSEGTMGIITSARLRVAVAPALRVYRGFEFDNVSAGLDAIRRVMQRGLRPAVVRLYDELDTLISAFKPHAASDAADAAEYGERRDGRRQAPIPNPGTTALPAIPGAPSGAAETGTSDIASRVRSGLRPGRALRRASRWLTQGNRRGWSRAVRREAMAAALARPRLLNNVISTVAERVTRRGCRMIIGLEGARIRTEVEARL